MTDCNGACDQGRRACPHPDDCVFDIGEPVNPLMTFCVGATIGVCWTFMLLAFTGHLVF
jgi:hypothetical protein